MFYRDEESVFDAPVKKVWDFLANPSAHEAAHHHRNVHRTRISDTAGVYSWEQLFDRVPTRFTMRWIAFAPVGIAYEVLEGPFEGSRFFLFYSPQDSHTRVTVVGEFVSPSLPASEVISAVDRFFTTEFEQDRDAIRNSGSPR